LTDFPAFFDLLFTHWLCFLRRPRLHFAGFLRLGFGLTPGGEGSKFPTPLNVTLDGVAKIGGAGGTP
jgi:hypothetical protein